MSEPIKLQDQLAAAFAPDRRGNRMSGNTESAWALLEDPHSLEPEDDMLPGMAGENSRAFGQTLAGISFLVSALALATGMESGFYILSVMMATIGVTSTIFLLRQTWQKRTVARAQKLEIPAREEAESFNDRSWEHNESLTLLSSIHDALGDIVLGRTMEGTIVHANTVFRELTGITSPVGRTSQEVGLTFTPTERQRQSDVEIQTRRGSRIFDWHDIVIRDAASGQLVVQSIGRDVTQERKAALDNAQALQRAEQVSGAKSRLLATVSHEVRTPLSGILGMSHLLAQTHLSSEQKNYLSGIRQSGDALVQLVDDLLDYASIEAGRFELRPRQENLRTLIENVVEMLSHRAHEKGIEIGSLVSPEVPAKIDVDAARLRQVLFNVIGNAVKFTETGGIMVEATMQKNHLQITVSDTGPGMSQSECARIFEEFEQLGTNAAKSSGTGLGLSISARICRAFGGALTVASERGVGSIFTIRFPVDSGGDFGSHSVRKSALLATRALVFAPLGPAANVLSMTIEALGGTCLLAETREQAEAHLQACMASGRPLTDMIVDHRSRGLFEMHFSQREDVLAMGARKILLVSPESRPDMRTDLVFSGSFDSWLIRPLREQTLVDVLCGRMKGIETRDALNDNRQTFVQQVFDMPQAPVEKAQGLNILFAEDDPVNAMLIKAVLIKAGHQVQHVSDFTTLSRILLDKANGRPDLLLTDVSMPGGSGETFIACLRHNEQSRNLPRLPVIVLTAEKGFDINRQLLLGGADEILEKPMDPETLLQLIVQWTPQIRRQGV
jgi:signal transduction histidine kinase